MSVKPSVVFLPGFLCDARLWTYHMKALAGDFEVQYVDLKKAADMAAMTSLIALQAPTKFHLVGFSMGGFVAQKFAVENQDRILSLTMVAANVGALPENEKKWRLTMEKTLQNSAYKGMSPKILDRYIHPKSLALPSVTETIIEMSRTFDSETYIRQMRATLDREDQTPALRSSLFQMLVVGGRQDRVVPFSSLEKVKAEIPRAELHAIEECGHYVPLEKPEALLGVLRPFLKANHPGND